MTLGAAMLSILCGLLWAGLDAARKGLAVHVAALPLVAAVAAAQTPIFGVWLAVEGLPPWDPRYLLVGGAAVVLNILALWMFVRALAIAPLSLTIPLLSLTPVLTALASIPLLGEIPSPMQMVGIALVVVGAASLGAGEGAQAADEAERRSRRRAVLKGRLLMVGVAALWAVTGPVDKLALGYTSLPFHAGIVSGGIALGLFLLLLSRRQLSSFAPLREKIALFSLATALGAAALGVQLLAIQFTLVSLVEAIKRALGMVAAVLNGRIFFAEIITWRKVLAVSLMCAGVLLLLLAP